MCLCVNALCKQLCTHMESIIRPPLFCSALILWGRISLCAWNLCFGRLGWKSANPLSLSPSEMDHRTTLCLFYGCWIQTPALMPEQQALLMDELPLRPLCISFDLRYFIFDFCSISWFILATFPLVFWNNIYLFLLLWLCGFISEGFLFFAVLYCFLNIFTVSHTMGPWLFKTKSVSRIIIFHPHSRSFPLHSCFSCLPTLTHNDYLFKH